MQSRERRNGGECGESKRTLLTFGAGADEEWCKYEMMERIRRGSKPERERERQENERKRKREREKRRGKERKNETK